MNFKNKETITVTELKSLLENNSPVHILDVRPKESREKPEITGSIFADVYDKLKSNEENVFDTIEIPKNIPVITYCGAGGISMVAMKQLRKKGIEAYSLVGGLNKWIEENEK